jgi:hypothetical protein
MWVVAKRHYELTFDIVKYTFSGLERSPRARGTQGAA